jgi:hypothetical protein
MSDKHLQTKPHQLKEQSAWWYEESKGIVVCCEGDGKVQQVKIRWPSLRAAMRRKDIGRVT